MVGCFKYLLKYLERGFMKVLFLGSSRFSKIVLNKMLDLGVNVVAVVTQPDRPSGRGHKLTPTEVKTFAVEKGIEVFTFDRIRLHMEEVKKIDFDISVVASFGQILPLEFLEYKPCINVHPSLLPKYRGASPIQNTILNGDRVGGVTIMKVAMEVDAGDIILQKEMAINGQYYLQLEEEYALLGGEMVKEVIDKYIDKSVTFTPQNHEKAIKVEKFNKNDGKLDFNCTAEKIVNRVRALAEEVGCYFQVGEELIKVCKVQDISGQFETIQNEILNNKKRFVIGCKNGAVEILECKAPSGKTVAGRDYLNGHNYILGKKVY